MNYFGAAALGFSGSYAPQPHNLHSSRTQQQRQQIRRVALAAAAASAGAAGVHLHRSGQITVPVLPSAAQVQQQRLLPKELAEVICGAIGEIVQVAVLYPLDTIKVHQVLLDYNNIRYLSSIHQQVHADSCMLLGTLGMCRYFHYACYKSTISPASCQGIRSKS